MIGSLCSGILGLDLAVERHYGHELAWCAEINPAASQVITARSGVTNYGDFRNVTPPPVEILTAGFPCQPVSAAGKRAGINDERWLFDDICDLLGRLDPPPRLLVCENVRGLLTANDGDAMARVVEGLARCGYVGSWRTVRASDVGAPHRRERVFIVAHSADTDGAGFGRRTQRDERTATGLEPPRRYDADRLDTATTDADGKPRPGERRQRAGQTVREPPEVERPRRRDRVDFGPFAPAVERWERILGRPAPAPVDDRGRLSAPFVEWMMGYSQGWVTDILDRRTDALRCLGNAVVPQQAAYALALLERVPVTT